MQGMLNKGVLTHGLLSLRPALELSRQLSCSIISQSGQAQQQSQGGEPLADRAAAAPSSVSHHFNLRAFYLGERHAAMHDLSRGCATARHA